MRLRLEATSIYDRASFHEAFRELFGFPEWYGANMDAWIDCMSGLTDAEAGLTELRLDPGEMLTIEVMGTEHLEERAPKVLLDLVVCTGIVNQRYFQSTGRPVISLVFL